MTYQCYVCGHLHKRSGEAGFGDYGWKCKSMGQCYRRVAERIRKFEKLRSIGQRMSNVLFNFSQRSQLGPDDAELMRLLCREWDGAQ